MSKLYTEEQVRGYLSWHSKQGYVSHKKEDMDEYLSSLIPIELPTDEEINDIIAFIDVSEPYNKGYHNGWMIGAKWMRDKIIR